MAYITINDKEHSIKLLKALHTQGVEIKVEKEKLSMAKNHVPHDQTIVIAKGDTYEVICGSISEQPVQRVRLFSKMILKKALKPPVVADQSRIDTNAPDQWNNRSGGRFDNPRPARNFDQNDRGYPSHGYQDRGYPNRDRY